MKTKSIVATSILSILMLSMAAPTNAASLLGIIGDKDSKSLITVGSGASGGNGLVNVGLGGGGGNILDANVGGSLVNANVSGGGGNGLGVNAGLLNDRVTANVGIGGGSGLGIGVGIGGGGNGGGGNGGGGNGGGGNGGGGNGNGGNGGGGNGGGGNGGNGGNGGGGNGGNGGGNGNYGANAGCIGPALFDAERLLRATTVTQRAMTQWQQTSNIQLVPVRFCPEVRSQVGRMLSQDPKAQLIQTTARGDQLISAALNRSNVRADNVLTIQNSGNVLRVFVY